MEELLRSIKSAKAVEIFGFYSRASQGCCRYRDVHTDAQTLGSRTARTHWIRRRITSKPRWDAPVRPHGSRGIWGWKGNGC